MHINLSEPLSVVDQDVATLKLLFILTHKYCKTQISVFLNCFEALQSTVNLKLNIVLFFFKSSNLLMLTFLSLETYKIPSKQACGNTLVVL